MLPRLTLAVLLPVLLWSQPSASGGSESDAPCIRLTLLGNFQFSSLKDWAGQFSPEPPTVISALGLEGEFFSGGLLTIGGGYEYGMSKTVKIQNSSSISEDGLISGFLFASMKLGSFLHFDNDPFYVYGGIDVGSLKGTETTTLSSGQKLESIGEIIALRPQIGGWVELNDRFTSTIEVAYMIGNIQEISIGGQSIPSYALNFSGFSVLIGISYALPVNL